jgi:hypothetical protein
MKTPQLPLIMQSANEPKTKLKRYSFSTSVPTPYK